MTSDSPVSPADLKNYLRVMDLLASTPAAIAPLSAQDRISLMKAAGSLAHPTIEEHRKTARAARKLRRERRKLDERTARQNTGIREGPVRPQSLKHRSSFLPTHRPA